MLPQFFYVAAKQIIIVQTALDNQGQQSAKVTLPYGTRLSYLIDNLADWTMLAAGSTDHPCSSPVCGPVERISYAKQGSSQGKAFFPVSQSAPH